MMRARLLAILPIIFLLAPLVVEGSDQVSPTVDISFSMGSVSSHGTIWYYCGRLLFSCTIDEFHELGDILPNGGRIGHLFLGTVSAGVTEKVYDDNLSWGGEVGHCYQVIAGGTGSEGSSQRVSSGTFCVPAPPPPVPINQCEDSSQAGCWSPLIVNVGPGDYALSGPDDPVTFDISATGVPVPMSWTARGSAMAFLALDRNGDGTVNNGAELFGNHTPLPGGLAAANGFDALAQYDSNDDGIVDTADTIWRYLLLWTDANHDAVSQPSEIVPVSASSVTAISLDYHWTGRRDRFGNMYRYQSQAWTVKAISRPVYDIFFVRGAE